MAPYAPLTVANTFIQRFAQESQGIEHMKLQKLVYCSYGWWLAHYNLNGIRLTTEGPQIWRHGPVFETLYKALKVFGREQIVKPQSANPFSNPLTVDDDEDVGNLIAWIWGRYGHLSSYALSDMTHKPGTPWHRVATENNFRIAYNTEIPDEYIYEEFTGLMNLNQVSSRNQPRNAGTQRRVAT